MSALEKKPAPQSYRVLWNHPVAKDTMQLGLQLEAGREAEFLPGRFVNLSIPDRKELLLRRPISVYHYDGETGVLELIIQEVGKGTQQLFRQKEGSTINLLGPLGNGFVPGSEMKTIWLVGGGIGVAPLYYLPFYYKTLSFGGMFGFRNKEMIYGLQNRDEHLSFLHLFTDDGSEGEKGFVTDGVKDQLAAGERPDAIFACGPVLMLRALQKLLKTYPQVLCYASLEERMGCGFGVCVGCACLVEQNGQKSMKRVCADGPVFPLNEVQFDG